MAEAAYTDRQRETRDKDDAWLVKRIQAVVRSGINSDDGEVTDARQDAYDAYMGEPYGNERDGYSKIVTREVLQAVEWALPALMRVFLGGVKAVEFRPSGPQDVAQAQHETEAVNYWFFDGNPEASGFMVLYEFLKDLLMNPNAYLSVTAAEEEVRDTQRLADLTDIALDALEAQGLGYEVDKKRKQVDPETGEKITLYDITRTEVKKTKRVVVETLAGDKVIVDDGHHKLSLERCKAVIVREEMTLSDVREMGYDLDVDDIKPSDDDVWNDEETNRLFYSDEDEEDNDDSYDLDADKKVVVHTAYMRVDWDGDGISELRRIIMAGCYICDNEEWDEHAVVACSAMPVPHRHVGMGYAELVMDLQQLMTTLTRQLLDNIYGQNVQRRYVNEAALLSDGTTMDALLDGTAEVILFRGDPSTAVVPETITPIVAEITGAMEALKELPQIRTGVAPQLSLDPSVLEKSTMGAFVGALDQASQRLELLARLVAETGLKPAMLKIHAVMREHFDEPQQVELSPGQFVTVDPRTWKKRSSMNVNVGLGFNNKQMMLMLLEKLMMMQREAMAIGLADEKKIYESLKKFIEQANLGHAGTYFNDPNAPGFQKPPPPQDPAMILAQAQSEALKREADRKDAETKATIAEKEEEKEANAAKLLNEFLGLKGKDALTTAQIAKMMAEITHLNMDKNAQEGPAEDSSADEFARAGGLVGDTAGDREADRAAKGPAKKAAGKPAGGKPAPKAGGSPKPVQAG